MFKLGRSGSRALASAFAVSKVRGILVVPAAVSSAVCTVAN